MHDICGDEHGDEDQRRATSESKWGNLANLGEYSEKRASKSKSKGAQKSEKESGEEGTGGSSSGGVVISLNINPRQSIRFYQNLKGESCCPFRTSQLWMWWVI
jgi:hypothetical protein